jgi:very-short-patch-repair endonuclease/predicted transcriptional regulator of viral defense system
LDHSPPPASVDSTIESAAARQHGVVTRRQLLDRGLSPAAIARRTANGRFRAIHRGVYLVGPTPPPLAPVMAACLACGPNAVASHRTAANIWDIDPTAPRGRGRRPDVAVRSGKRRPNGVRVHRLATLDDDEVTTCHGIPVTTPARTLLDLAAAGARRRTLERVLAEALTRRVVTAGQVRATADRHRGRAGSAHLRTLLDDGRPMLTRSEAEERFLALMRKAEAPRPKTNVRIGDLELDVYWPDERLAVEIDGFQYHESRRSFESDRRRDVRLAGRGIRVVRVTWRQIERAPEALLFSLGQAFRRSA